MDIKAIQQRLVGRGFALAVDGTAGVATWTAMLAFTASRSTAAITAGLGAAFAAHVPATIRTDLGIIHLLGQGSVETMGFTRLRELWGPTPTQQRYEGRADLGNTQAGDGKRFMGRGVFQTTGRDNYRAAGQAIGVPLEAQPELAERPDVAVQTALVFWRDHALQQWADADDVLAMSRAVNCGNPRSPRTPNGLADRQVATARARVLILGAGR